MNNRETVFIGVDLGTSMLRKSTGLAYLVEKNGKPLIEVPPEHMVSDDRKIRDYLTGLSGNSGSSIIGIDAPLSRPEHGTMRECERRLRKHGIPCYPSGAQWVSGWVNKGIGLKKWAEKELGARVIEVYPYAARRILHIGIDEKKKSKEGRKVIQDALFGFIAGLDEIAGDRILFDDQLDAILSAYVAYCEGNGTAYKIDGKDGVIYVPMKMRNHTINEY
jgi:predicted nuclease with RNAse H fold